MEKEEEKKKASWLFIIDFSSWRLKLLYKEEEKMVPQQQDSPSSSGIPLFGSLLVDKNSSTPYSDATQVNDTTYKYTS